MKNFSLATVRGSSVEMFFRRKTEWSNMHRVMEAHNFLSVDQAIQAVRQGSVPPTSGLSTRGKGTTNIRIKTSLDAGSIRLSRVVQISIVVINVASRRLMNYTHYHHIVIFFVFNGC